MESLPWTSIISHLNESIDLQDDKGQHITCTPSKRLIRTNRTYPITTEAWQPIDPVNEDTFILTKFISPEPASLRRPRSLIFLVLVICLGAKTGPTLYTNGTAKSSDSATLECFQMLTQPLKFCTSVTKCSLLPFIRFPPFIPTLTPPPPQASPGSSVLPARLAEPWWRHTTGRGQRRGWSILLILLEPPILSDSLSSQQFCLCPFNKQTSAAGRL